MKIGVVSDTHDHIETYGKIAEIFARNKVGMIVHCGDWVAPYSVAMFAKTMLAAIPGVTIQGVFGNNDGDIYRTIEVLEEQQLPVAIARDILEFKQGNAFIAVYHGTEETIVDSLLRSGSYQAVFRGHTHVPALETRGATLHLNPGTVCSYSNGTIITEGTVAIYDPETNKAEMLSFPRL